MNNFKYAGSELELFANATNWKSYWSNELHPYCGVNILEVGAGIGATARVFHNHQCERWVALEPDENLASQAKIAAQAGEFPANYKIHVGYTQSLDQNELFDTILYIDVLEHITDHKEELTRAAKHLLPGGRIIVLSPAHQWLFTPFDQAVGHVRRYNRASLLSAKPDHLNVERIFYLDSVGMFASLGNRLVLRSAMPNLSQIKIWDDWMVPASRVVDKLIFNSIGKTIVGIFQHPI
jgi:SAM-dependent methyltransferase